jgi:lipase chaperone LimK
LESLSKKFPDVRNTKIVDVIAPITESPTSIYPASPQAVKNTISHYSNTVPNPKNLMQWFLAAHAEFLDMDLSEYKIKQALYDVKEFWVLCRRKTTLIIGTLNYENKALNCI